MRKLIVTNIAPLDGYYAGPGENVMALPMDNSFDEYNAERLATADTLLLGGTSYEMFKSFWPQMVDNPEATPAHKQICRLENAIDKVVVTDSLTADQTDPWTDTTRIVRRDDAHEEIAKLKDGSGKDILIFGSRILWNDLLSAGLADELRLMVGTVVLGAGTPVRQQDVGLAPASGHAVVRWLRQHPRPLPDHRVTVVAVGGN